MLSQTDVSEVCILLHSLSSIGKQIKILNFSKFHKVLPHLPAMGSVRFCVETSAGRSPWFYLWMFVSDICDQTSNISDYGVASVNQTE